jgi:methionyl-tRNA synthetase
MPSPSEKKLPGQGKTFYLTTTIPYVNADPHIGFALEIVQADAIARYKKLLGYEVFFNTGTDEHGVKIYRKSQELKIDIQKYVDDGAEKFRGLKKLLGLSDDLNFVRTTDEYHQKAAQEFWRRCLAAGDIYKKNYKIKYCVGCELEKTDSELVDGKCPLHPNLTMEIIDEENYFFRLSKFKESLLKLYEKTDFVIPSFRFNEIKVFVERGLEDFSISRLKNKMPWGVQVPDDPDHVMYVWFDAFINYISAIGWPGDMTKFKKWWPVVQFAGKDQIRQQAAMWQAMLMSVGIEPSKQIVIHGFITSGGQKMSKSLGNVMNPYDIVAEYGTDALRYYLLAKIPSFEDGDFTMEKLKDTYNADLANGLGNLVSRILRMSTSNNIGLPAREFEILDKDPFAYAPYREYFSALARYEINKACEEIWFASEISVTMMDKLIQTEQPFKLIKTDFDKAKNHIQIVLRNVYRIGKMLEPILPDTAREIQRLIKTNTMPEKPLFPRKD